MGTIIRNGIIYGTTMPVDNTLSEDSTNPVQNKVVKNALDNIVNGNTVVGKATSDANGNNIANTYQPIIDTDNKLNSDMVDDGDDEPTPLHKFVTQSQKEDIANTKTKVSGINSTTDDCIKLNNGTSVYFSNTAPTGDIPDGAIGIGF